MSDKSTDAHRRRTPPRWLIVLLVLVVLLPLAGAVTLKAMFPPERLREIAEPQLEKRIARDVELGQVRLKVFPNIAIRLEDVRISNPPQGFSDAAAVQMAALDLRLELLPLLRRQYRLSQVRLVAPRVRYEVAADGSNNLAGLLATDSTVSEGAEDAPAGSNFDVEDLVAVDGAFAYVNSESRRAARIGFEGRLDIDEARTESGPLASTGAFRLFDGLTVADGRDTTRIPDVDVTYRAVFEQGGGRVAIPELSVRAAGLVLSGEAASRLPEGEETRTVRLELASEEFDLGDLIRELPSGMVADTLEIDGNARLDLRVAGEIGGEPGPRLDGSAAYSNVSLSTPGRGRVADAVRGTLAFSTTSLSSPDVTGRLLGRPFEARVRIDEPMESSPAIDGHLSGQFGLEQLNDFRDGEPLPVEGSASVEIDFRGPAKAMDRWNVTGPIRLSNVVWASETLPQPATIASATLQLTGAGVRADAVPVRLGESDLSVTFSSAQLVRHYLTEEAARGPAPLIEFTARSNRLAAANLSRGRSDVGYADLLKARLAGRDVDGKAPEAIAAERYRKPDLTGYRASGRVSVGEWVNPPTNASNVSFRLDLADGLVDITDVSGTVYGGRLTGGVQVDLRGDEPPYELAYDLQFQGVRAGDLLQRWTRLGRAISGSLNFDIAGSAPLDDTFLPLTTGLAALGSTSLVEGRFEDFDLPQALRSHLNLGAERLRNLRDLGGPFEIRDGQFVVRNWTFGSGDIQGAVSGAAGLGGVLDLDLALLLPRRLLGNTPIASNDATIGRLLGQLGGNDAETIPLRLGVGGTMSSPALRIDADALASSLQGRIAGAGRERLDQGRERLEREGQDRLQDAASGLLDRLRGGARDTARAGAAAPSDSAATDTAGSTPDTTGGTAPDTVAP